MSSRELGVPPALAGLVECAWVDTAAADGAHAVLPDGCMDLICGPVARVLTAPAVSWTVPADAACAVPSDAGSVAALADALGCTPRSVHRRCLAAFGYGPSVLRRVLRFRRAAALLRAGVAPAVVAAAAGYADQPHLSRERRALAGVSPATQLVGAR